MTGRTRTYAWLALAGLALGLAFERYSYWHHLRLGDFLFAKNQPLMTPVLNWGVFVVPRLLFWVPLFGAWSLFRSRWIGPGRVWWRWWIGGSLVAMFLWDLVEGLVFHFRPRAEGHHVYSLEPYPFLGPILVLLAMIPLWFLAKPRKAR